MKASFPSTRPGMLWPSSLSSTRNLLPDVHVGTGWRDLLRQAQESVGEMAAVSASVPVPSSTTRSAGCSPRREALVVIVSTGGRRTFGAHPPDAGVRLVHWHNRGSSALPRSTRRRRIRRLSLGAMESVHQSLAQRRDDLLARIDQGRRELADIEAVARELEHDLGYLRRHLDSRRSRGAKRRTPAEGR
jgi:hypothetical protein